MANFKEALELTLQEMLKQDDNMCCAVYNDDMCTDNAIVMFMEYGGYGTMHAVMKDLHARLSYKMGHPVAICHNHPTDESVLIHSSAHDAEPYFSDECCKRDAIRICKHIIEDESPGYRSEYRAMANAAEAIGVKTGTPLNRVLSNLDWNKDILLQLITQLLK